MSPHRLLLGCWTLCVASAPLAAEALRFESPAQRVTVVELFTSHGCNSCPPADAWLRRFTEDPALWQRVIPLAFHVDYWDYLGWQDRFAAPAYSQRQRDYRHSGGLGSVYTPGVLVNGKEWRGWYHGDDLPAADAKPVGRLTLEVEPERSAVLELSPDAGLAGEGLQANLAILGIGMTSRIGGGENSGRSLGEDFVVLGESTASHPDRPNTWHLEWPHLRQHDGARYAVVAWLSRGGDPTPLQATGGWLP
ncbi:MAG: DUF1223 domain-containing protein [Candidatus Thiodiazotropha sp.]